MEQFKYVGATLTNQNSIQEEIKSKLSSEKACYHSVQNLLSSSLQSKNIKIKLHIEGRTQAEDVENRVLKRILGPKRKEVTGEWRKSHNKKLSDLYSSPNIVWVMKSRRMRWMEHRWGIGEVQMLFGGKPSGIQTTWKT